MDVQKVKVDLIILCEEVNSYDLPLHASIIETLNSSHTHQMIGKSGGVYIIDKSKTSLEEIHLLFAVARLIIKGDGGILDEQIEETIERVSEKQRDSVYSKAISEYVDHASEKPDLLYPNGLGGFTEDGREYVIQIEKNNTTPAPWINVISNPNLVLPFLNQEQGICGTETAAKTNCPHGPMILSAMILVKPCISGMMIRGIMDSNIVTCQGKRSL